MGKKTLLVPIDGSAFSEQVLPELTGFFGPERAKLILLYVKKGRVHTIKAEDEAVREELPLMMSGATAYAQVGPSMPQAGPDTESLEGSVYASQLEDQMREEAAHVLNPVKDRLEAEGYEVSAVGRLGQPGEQIIEYLEEEEVDLVAMTTHCRSSLGRIFLGSVARYVLRHAAVPILLVRPCKKGG